MPVSRSEFDRGKKDTWVAKKVVDFLKKNKGNAFTSNEIMNGIGYRLDPNSLLWNIAEVWTFNATLKGLVDDGRIITKKVSFMDYYMIK